MGAELIKRDVGTTRPLPAQGRPDVPSVPRLDAASAAAVVDIVQSLAAYHSEVLAVILFGSVARHEERSLDDPQPSDVDLLLLLDAGAITPGARRLPRERELAIHRTIIEADYPHQSPREITVLFAYRDLERWDPLFIENVARDGILLWARGPLPRPLAAIGERDLLRSFAAPSHSCLFV